jgi:tetratricopeptide (TPR) repeat protein
MLNSNIISFPNILINTEGVEHAMDMLIDGRFEEARDRLIKLVDQDIFEANLYLGYVYCLNPEHNSILDYEKAYFYFERAIETTYSVEALVGVALLFGSGVLGKKNIQGAMDIFLDLEDDKIFLDGYVFWMLGNFLLWEAANDSKNIDAAERYFNKGWALKHLPSLSSIAYCKSYNGQWVKALIYRLRALPLVLFYMIFDRNHPRMRH